MGIVDAAKDLLGIKDEYKGDQGLDYHGDVWMGMSAEDPLKSEDTDTTRGRVPRRDQMLAMVADNPEDALMMAMVEEGIAEYEEWRTDDDTLTLTEEQRVKPPFIRPAKPVVTTKDLDRANMLANR